MLTHRAAGQPWRASENPMCCLHATLISEKHASIYLYPLVLSKADWICKAYLMLGMCLLCTLLKRPFSFFCLFRDFNFSKGISAGEEREVVTSVSETQQIEWW